MNIVSKSLVLISLVSLGVYADECALVSFQTKESIGDDYITVIGKHNDGYVEKYYEKHSILSPNHSYYLEEGTHSIVIEHWPKKVFRKLKKNNRVRPVKQVKPVYSQVLQLTVEPNYRYMLDTHKDELNSFYAKVGQKNKEDCSSENNSLLKAKKHTQTINIDNESLLPVDLEYRMRKLMTQIKANHIGSSDSDRLNNIFQTKFERELGMVIDNRYTDDSGIQILTVLPYSISSHLGLFSGDKITKLGKNYINRKAGTPTQQVATYFSSLRIGQKLAISLTRNNNKLTLDDVFRPEIIPEVTYQILDTENADFKVPELINNTRLPRVKKFQFDLFIIELAKYFESIGYESGIVKLNRNEIIDQELGLIAEKVELSGKVGLKVTGVKSQSQAELIGLTNLDTIVSINNHELNEYNINALVNSLNNLSSGTSVTFSIMREGKKIELLANLVPQNLTAFSLSLDLDSISTLNNLSEKLKENYRKGHNNMEYDPGNNFRNRSTRTDSTNEGSSYRPGQAQTRPKTTGSKNW
jgi:C-terminal processing protease CtpA/Prc